MVIQTGGKHKSSWIREYLSLRNLFTFFIPVFIAILLIMLYNLSVSVEHLSVSLVNESADEATLSIKSRFEPVMETVKSIGSWEFEESSEILDFEKLNSLLIPTVLQSDQISSMMISATDGKEYMLLDAGNGYWNNRITRPVRGKPESMRYLWKYRPYESDSLIRTWHQEDRYDPRVRIWFKGALTMPGANQIYWTSPYIFFTTKEPGITASVYSFSASGDTIITAFDVLLKDVNRISQSIEMTTNGVALILTANTDQVAGLPAIERFMHADSVKKYILTSTDDLGLPVLCKSLDVWEEESRTGEPFQFRFDRETWWAGISPVRTGESDPILYSVILVPESDFLAEMNRTRLVIIGGFSLVLVLTVLVIRAYNQIRKKNSMIESQKHEIEEKNREITDSIVYAERIQHAVLPADQKISRILPDCFILFLPKDIVSGDFFWMEKRGNTSLFAAVDCTGHGVPGAFVSIVGHGGLSRAVREYNLTETDSILCRLNLIVSETFQKSINEEIKDGMDIALCALDTDSMMLQYSGAKNPLYLVRRHASALLVNGEPLEPLMSNENAGLFEIKADRIGIEPREEMPEFSRHEIRLEKNDHIYIFSDGLPDQFGGPKNKKFTYRRFREQLLSLSHLELAEQESSLKKSLDDWKGNNEQVDDILVMGILVR